MKPKAELCIATCLWASLSSTAYADEITKLSVTEQVANVVTITIDGKSRDGRDIFCGVWVEFGDGHVEKVRISKDHGGVFPRKVSHTYQKVGAYSILAQGGRASNALSCAGKAHTAVVIESIATPVANDAGSRQATIAPNIETLQFQARNGSVSAMTQLGMMYLTGEGVPQNDKQARNWFEVAAQKADPSAIYYLGYMREEGRATLQNAGEAFKLYSRAAKLGHVDAMMALVDLYRQGRGTGHDPIRAYAWLIVAQAVIGTKADRGSIEKQKKEFDQLLSSAEKTKAEELAQMLHAGLPESAR